MARLLGGAKASDFTPVLRTALIPNGTYPVIFEGVREHAMARPADMTPEEWEATFVPSETLDKDGKPVMRPRQLWSYQLRITAGAQANRCVFYQVPVEHWKDDARAIACSTFAWLARNAGVADAEDGVQIVGATFLAQIGTSKPDPSGRQYNNVYNLYTIDAAVPQVEAQNSAEDPFGS